MPANWEGFKAIKEVVTKIPVAVNGDVMCYEDIAKIKAITGTICELYIFGVDSMKKKKKNRRQLVHDRTRGSI